MGSASRYKSNVNQPMPQVSVWTGPEVRTDFSQLINKPKKMLNSSFISWGETSYSIWLLMNVLYSQYRIFYSQVLCAIIIIVNTTPIWCSQWVAINLCVCLCVYSYSMSYVFMHVHACVYFWHLILTLSSKLSQSTLHLEMEMDCPVSFLQNHCSVTYVYDLLYLCKSMNIFMCAHTLVPTGLIPFAFLKHIVWTNEAGFIHPDVCVLCVRVCCVCVQYVRVCVYSMCSCLGLLMARTLGY